MAECAICGDQLEPGAKSCGTCGTAVLPAVDNSSNTPNKSTQEGAASSAADSLPSDGAVQAGLRECPECHESYGPEYTDEFCHCGAALTRGTAAANHAPVDAGALQPASTPASPSALLPKPTAGTVCLVVYSADRQPVFYYPIDKDVTLIGRSDPVRGDFPDLDLGCVLDGDACRRISRKHALLLRSRETGGYILRPLARNTGTQIERSLAQDLTDYALTEGNRIILGGAVRLKFETIK